MIGAGISGLTAAYDVCTLRPDARVVVYEASSRLGGVLGTFRDGDYLIEQAADNFLRGPTAPWAEQLCTDLGIAPRLLPTQERNRGAHIFWQGRLHHVPAGFQLMAPSRWWPIMTSSLLSPAGRARLCLEPFIREPLDRHDESLESFAVRRLGREAFERLVQPLVSGIYTADPSRLSVQSALPQMMSLVREHGSLSRGMQRRKGLSSDTSQHRGARYSLFTAPQNGTSELVQALAKQMTSADVRLQTRVQHVTPSDAKGWLVDTDANEREEFAAVIVALPAHEAAAMFEGPATMRLANGLREIEYASSAVICLGFRASQIKRRLDAFGCVVPRAAGRSILAVSYASLKFPGRAPEGRVLLRVFVGGALQPQLAELANDPLVDMVRSELAAILAVDGEPEVCHVVRWPRSMPQYNLGHAERVAAIQQRLGELPGLQLAGNGLHGVGIPQCVRSGRQAAQRTLELLPPSTT